MPSANNQVRPEYINDNLIDQLESLAGANEQLLLTRNYIDSQIVGLRNQESGTLCNLEKATVRNEDLNVIERSAWQVALHERGNRILTFADRLAMFQENFSQLKAVDKLLCKEGAPLLAFPVQRGTDRPFEAHIYKAVGTGLRPKIERGGGSPRFSFSFSAINEAGDRERRGQFTHDISTDEVLEIHTSRDVDAGLGFEVFRMTNDQKERFLGKEAIGALLIAKGERGGVIDGQWLPYVEPNTDDIKQRLKDFGLGYVIPEPPKLRSSVPMFARFGR